MSQEVQEDLLTYKELLKELENSSSSHLLLGNGFNNSLGIKTNYSEIFLEMKGEYSSYGNVESHSKGQYYDIEELIGYLKEQVQSNDSTFLKNYIERKVKLDFMKATNKIVQDSIKKVYQEKNQGIYLLLKNFTKYFTLNYDPFLYLLLMKFKKDEGDSGKALAIQNTSLFQEDELNSSQNNIYAEIKEARESGIIDISIGNNKSSIDLKNIKKSQFEAIIKGYNEREKKGWTFKDISTVCTKIWKEESNNNQAELYINDGFQQGLFTSNKEQNLYFLHGTFHIIKNKKETQKITAKQNKSFCEKLEEAIHDEDKGIVCVLTNESNEKKTQIEKNSYLSGCFNNLSKIDGSLVILGSSLAENDKHIFNQISNSGITQIYISSSEDNKKRDFKRASSLFKNMKITLFNYKTISYKEEDNR